MLWIDTRMGIPRLLSPTLQEFEETFWRPFEDQLRRAAQESEAALYSRRGDVSKGDHGEDFGDDEVIIICALSL